MKHIPALDGLRGMAVLMVLVGHGFWGFPKMAWLGFGVTIFFVLSGFLITGILVETKEDSNYFKSFYWRRALRIFPLYYLSITVIILLFGFNWKTWIGFAIYAQNILVARLSTSPLMHFWSLAVEEQFYMFWPLVVFALSRRWLTASCVALIILAAVCRSFCLHTGQSAQFYYRFPLHNFDGLAVGALVSIAIRAGKDLRKIALVVAVVAIPLFNSFYEVRVAMAGALLVLALNCKWLTNQLLCWFGKRSYGIYVVHYPIWVFFILPHIDEIRSVFQALIETLWLLVVSSGVAHLSWELMESKILRFKESFYGIRKTKVRNSEVLTVKSE